MSQPNPATPTATAYSYIRFSTPQQKTGDSLRRQTEARDQWLTAHPWVKLDTKLRMTDEGVSARHGANRDDKAALGAFLNLVEANRIPRGSYLTLENLDRLSRQDVHEGLYLLLGLIRKGIRVVQLMPAVTEFSHTAETGDDLSMKLMIAIMELRRGNSESVMKEERLGAVWQRKRANPVATGKDDKGSHRFPGWVKRDGDTLYPVEEHKKTIQNLFKLLAAGYGFGAIAEIFNKDKVPTFGRKPYWSGSTLHSVATNRAVLGEYQPKTQHKTKGERVKIGEAVAGFYPAVIDEATWHKAQGAIMARKCNTRGKKPGSGRVGRVNLFAGLVKDGVSGGSFLHNVGTRSNLMEPYFNRGAKIPGPCSASFPVEVFERAMIREMGNIDFNELLPHEVNTANEVETLSAERAHCEAQIAEAEADILAGGKIGRWSGLINKLSEKVERLTGLIEEAKARSSTTVGEALGDMAGLFKAIDDNPLPETRMRLRTAIRRVVKAIWLVVKKDGVKRTVLAQIQFNDGIPDYLVHIGYTQAGQGPGWVRPASWDSARFIGSTLNLSDRAKALEFFNRVPLVDDPDDED